MAGAVAATDPTAADPAAARAAWSSSGDDAGGVANGDFGPME